MTKLRPEDDWPRRVSFHGELARGSKALRTWVGSSPRRALSADGMTLFVARRHGLHRLDGSINVWDAPPDEGGEGLFVVDVFHATADAGGYFQTQELAPGVDVLRLDSKDGCLRVVLRLTEEQRQVLGVADATVDLAWPTAADGGLARVYFPLTNTMEGSLQHLAELLAIGGIPGGTLAREAAARRRDLDDREARRQAAHRSMRERLRVVLARNARVEELALPQAQALDQAVARVGLGRCREALRRLARPCWALAPGTGTSSSRIGGVPDLPRGAAWPTWDGKPLHFICQVNLAELPTSIGLQMPRDGMLSLFTGLLEPANDVEHLVLYTPAGIDTCRMPCPAGGYRDEQLHIHGSTSLFARVAVALPDHDSEAYRFSVGGELDHGDTERYLALQNALSGLDHATALHMMGYPAVSGAQPEATAFFRTAGRPDSRYWVREELDTDDKIDHFHHVHEHLDEIVPGILDWVPLFRLPSYSKLGLVFWDAGTLNIMIRRNEFAALRFEQTVAIIAT
jgi:uncharacterized protein DUF1963